MNRKHYNCRWVSAATLNERANVSFEATHDENAKRKADKIAKELGVTNCPRTLYEGNRLVDQKAQS